MSSVGKKIKSITIVKPGSNPDVDSDFNTEIRDNVIEHVTEIYGEDNVANIITFNTLAAKSAFKAMCTIYNVPFSKANKIASLVPGPIEGVDCTLDDIFNPSSDRYSEGAEFRQATSDEYWTELIEGAKAIEGRVRSTGVHPCFPAGELVKTNSGYKKIEEITTNDKVLTHTNTYKNVIKTMVNKNNNLFLLETFNSLPTEVTGNHPYYTRKIISDGRVGALSEPKWTAVSDLIPKTDLIGVPVNQKEELPINDYKLPYNDKDFWWIIGNFIKTSYISINYNSSKKIHNLDDKNKDDFQNFIKSLYKNNYEKVISDEILNLPIKLLKSFLNGYFSKIKNFNLLKDNEVTFSTTNKELFLSIISIINKVYKVSVKTTFETKDYSNIFIGAFSNNKEYSFYDNGYIWGKIKKVSPINKNVNTYNLSVLDDNSYTVNNLIVHNCGLVMSSKPLSDVIPLHVRQDDKRVITQWTYKECESLGLIKMDLLGLDTVDLIQNTVNYISKAGKTPPNMLELIHGDMDDKKTFDMLKKGDSIGIFQLASPGVRDLLKRMNVDKFEDIVATTALYRPGPMEMLSHVKYADRKNGREELDAIHPEFVGSDLDNILSKTYNLLIFQEQIIRIANQIGGMTLQEGDELRAAMGKKKIKIMLKMKPKFMEGGKANGFSEEALNTLWNTMEPFAKYAFNRSHSVAYGMAAYQAAYLKANYLVEFIAALLAQNVDDKDKILSFLQEARNQGLKVGTVDINISDIRIAPDFKDQSDFDIVYGLSGVKAVSKDMAKIIVEEREKNGSYKNIQDVINRCTPLGVSNKKIYENLAKAGAFDCFNISRQGVVNNLVSLMGEAKTKNVMGTSLFDLLGAGDDNTYSIDFKNEPEYPFVEKIKEEANVIGLYLTDHPLGKAGKGLSSVRDATIKKLLSSNRKSVVYIAGAITEIESKILKRGGKNVKITIDDGSSYITANLSRNIVKNIDKTVAMKKLEDLYRSGDNEIPEDIRSIIKDPKFTPMKELEKNSVYVIRLTFRPAWGDSNYGARVDEIRPLQLADNGMLPIRVRLDSEKLGPEKMDKLNKALAPSLSKKFPGDYPIYIADTKTVKKNPAISFTHLKAIEIMDSDFKNNNKLKEKVVKEEVVKNVGLDGKVSKTIQKKKASNKKEDLRIWPPKLTINNTKETNINNNVNSIEDLEYVNSNYTADKNNNLEQAIEKLVGLENYDFGAFNTKILE